MSAFLIYDNIGMNKIKTCAFFVVFLLISELFADGSDQNEYVLVSSKGPRIDVETLGRTDFNVFAPGYADSFVTNVFIRPISDWILVKPQENEQPLQMKGGDESRYKVKKPPEDYNKGGTIYFNNYYISTNKGERTPIVTVPTGKSVTYTSYRDNKKTSSNWRIRGNGVERKVDNCAQIIFERLYWNVPDWFIPAMPSSKAGRYEISAEDATYPKQLFDQSEMDIVAADFIESSKHNYGFDDFTGWTWLSQNWPFATIDKAEDYYLHNKKYGRSIWPYASVAINKDGFSFLRLQPDDNANDVYTIVSSSSDMVFAPQTLSNSKIIGFSCINTGEYVLSLKKGTDVLAKLNVIAFTEDNKSLLIVGVNGAYKAFSKLALNNYFSQCAIKFEIGYTTLSIDAPVVGRWTDIDRQRLIEKANENICNQISTYDHVAFLLDGEDSENVRIEGRASVGGKWIWLYRSLVSVSGLAHELGHNLGLDDVYTHDSGGNAVSGKDKKNIMNNTVSADRFRYGQWKKMR